MRLQRSLLPLALGLLAGEGQAQDVGSSIPHRIELSGFAQTQAQSYDDLFGRLVLIEFFAYW